MTQPLGFTPAEVAAFAKELAPLLTNGGNLITLIAVSVVIVLLHIVQMGVHIKTSKCFGGSVEFQEPASKPPLFVRQQGYGLNDETDV